MKNQEDNKLNEEDLLDANFLPADHHLLSRMQKTLLDQHIKEEERLKLELNKKSKILLSLDKQKEDIGVQLYEQQQKLVEFQKSLEWKQDTHKEQVEIREKNEKSVKILEKQIKEMQEESDLLNTQLQKRIEELSKQNLTIKEIETFNESLGSKIKQQKRITYKMEENIQENERLKNRQDFLIFNLMEEQKKIKEQKDFLSIQVKVQKNETNYAQKALKEQQDEIDKIILSKKALCGNLQKASLDLEEKNKTLIQVKERVQAQIEEVLKKENEIIGIHKEIQNFQQEKAKLSEILDKIEKEGKNLEQESEKIEEKMVKTQAKNEQLVKACSSTEEEIKLLKLQQQNIQREMNLIEGNIMKFHTEIKEKQEEMLVLISNHKTKEKLQMKLLKQIKQMEMQNQEKRLEMENLNNEISRINLDILNTQNQIGTLEENRQGLNKERRLKEETINKYEIIIRENHDAHERKMHEVAKFNREHDKAKQKMEIIGRGPSEIILIQLNKEIQNFNRERKKLEGEFIKSQTRAVEREIQSNDLQGKITHLKRKVTVLEQKKIRLNNEYIFCQKNIKDLQLSLKNYEKDMNKLNDFLAIFKDKSNKLNNQTININSEFSEKMKNLEKESAKLEIEIEKLRVEKAKTLEETMECERQILLWERKIELEKEMQSTLDPNVGQQEIKNLQKELHLKQLRLNELKKQQDQLILEIEKVVNKRDNINLKYNAKEMCQNIDLNTLKKNKQPNKKNQLAKNIQLYKASIKQTQTNIKKLEKESNKLQSLNDKITKEIENNQDKIIKDENFLQQCQDQIMTFELEKVINILKVFQSQQKAFCLEKIIKNGKKQNSNMDLNQKLNDQYSKNKMIFAVLETYCQEEKMSSYQNILQEIKGFLNN